MKYVLSHKNEDFYYLYEMDDKFAYGYRITKFYYGMNSFTDYDETKKIKFSIEDIENKKYKVKDRSIMVYTLSKVVEMKDSEYKFIV